MNSESSKQNKINIFKSIYDDLNNPVIIINENKTIYNLNKAAKKLINNEQESIIGKNCNSLYNEHPNNCISCSHRSLEDLSTGKTKPKIINLKNKTFLVTTSIFYEEDNSFKFIDILYDTTDIKENQDLNIECVYFQELFKRSKNGIVIYEAINNGADFLIRNINQAALKIENRTIEDCLNLSCTQAFSNIKDIGLYDVINKVYNSGNPTSFTAKIITKKDKKEFREYYLYKLLSDGVVAIYEETTHKEIKNNLTQELSSKQNELIQQSPLPIFTINKENKITLINTAFKELFNLHPEQAIGKEPSEIFEFPADDLNKIRTKLKAFFKTHEKQTVIEINTETGKVFKAYFSLIFQNNSDYEIQIILQDITQEKMFLKEQLLNEKRMESLLRISQLDANSDHDLLDYALEEAISLTESQFGYIYLYDEKTKQFILNSWSKDVMKECEIVEKQTQYHLGKTGLWGEAVRQRRAIINNNFKAHHPHKKGYPEGHVHLKKFLTTPIFSDDNIVCVIGVANKQSDYKQIDVTQLNLLMDSVWNILSKKEYEAELIKAKLKAEESDKLKSTFLANMSHEIRTPMNAILGFSSLLSRPNLSETKKAVYIDTIRSRSSDLMQILNDIIDISKIDSGLVEIVHDDFILNEVLKELYDVYIMKIKTTKTKLNLKLNLEFKDLESTIIGDELRIKQILTNLLDNALKFTREGNIEFGYKLKNNDLLFYVKDNGIGIPKKYHQIIFQRFRQTDESTTRKFGGTGLGLSICKAFTNLLNGDIWVESEEGVGSTFWFNIPYVSKKSDFKESDEIQNINTIDTNSWEEKNILIVEDVIENQVYFEEILEDSKIQIDFADTGQLALDLIKKNNYDLILMDLQLPDISGLEITRKLRITENNTPIIAQTAFAMESDKVKCLKAGCNDYISKPINEILLLEKMSQFLGKKTNE